MQKCKIQYKPFQQLDDSRRIWESDARETTWCNIDLKAIVWQSRIHRIMIDLAQILFVYVSPIIVVTILLLLNIAEIYSIFRPKKKKRIKSSVLAYVLNLSISDVFVGFAIIIAKLIFYIWKYTNNSTSRLLFYVVRYYLVRFSLFVSVFSLITMTLIRWLAVKHPMNHQIFIRK